MSSSPGRSREWRATSNRSPPAFLWGWGPPPPAPRARGPRPFPPQTALGSLCHYVSGADPTNYQPANITFDLLPELDEATRHKLRNDKKARHTAVSRRALTALTL